MNGKQKFIDCHTHIFKLYDREGRNCFDFYDEIQKNSGASAINVLAFHAGSDPGKHYDVRQNILAALYKLRNSTVYAYGGLAYPEFPIRGAVDGMDPATQHDELMEIGFDGIKLLEARTTTVPMLGKHVNDPYFEGFFDKAEKKGTHIISHVASPLHYWDPAFADSLPERCHYWKGDHPSVESIYGATYDVLAKHPKLKITFAHFFFLAEKAKTAELEALFERYENVGVDLTPGTEMYAEFNKAPAFYKAFLEKHADRIMHGTDVAFPSSRINYMFELSTNVYDVVTADGDGTDIWGVSAKGLKLSDEACEKILYGNFKRLHPEPKKINVEALKRYTQKYKHLIADDEEKDEILRLVDEA